MTNPFAHAHFEDALVVADDVQDERVRIVLGVRVDRNLVDECQPVSLSSSRSPVALYMRPYCRLEPRCDGPVTWRGRHKVDGVPPTGWLDSFGHQDPPEPPQTLVGPTKRELDLPGQEEVPV